MQVSDFDYDLPQERIALHPPKLRGTSRLLVLHKGSGQIEHKGYGDFVSYLSAGDVVVINDTKVIRARLVVKNEKGQDRELLLLEKHGHDDDWHTHKALYRGTMREGESLKIHDTELEISRVYEGGIALIKSTEDLEKLAENYGTVPLPPYMKRLADKEDLQRYQTVFARDAGSVAAPTASLNITEKMLEELRQKGVQVAHMTLHVGMGTFLPIRVDSLENHKMHQEYFEIPAESVRVIQAARKNGNKVLAIGTTVTRALEYAAEKLNNNGMISGEADIFIYPGYEFKVVDMLLTNFHAPKSTVLMMAAAFAGWDKLKPAYKEAVAQEYSLLSYGDSMLIV